MRMLGVIALGLLIGSAQGRSHGSPSFTRTGEARSPQGATFFLGNEALPPINYLKDGYPTGVVVDLARAIAQRMPRRVEIRLMNWTQAQQLVLEGRAEALLQINPSPERQQLYDFSQPLLTSDFTIFTTSKHFGIASVRALEGLQVGLEEKGLPALLLMGAPGIRTRVLPDFTQGFRMLADGALDAIVADRWVGSFVVAQNGIEGIRVSGPPISSSQSAIAVKKGNQGLLREINEALAEIRRDGTYDRIIEAWRPKEVVFRTREQLRRQAWLLGIALLALVLALAGIGALAREVRRRRRAEEALRTTEQRFRLALRNAPVSVAVQGHDFKYLWAYNQRTARPEDIIGRTDREIFRPEEAERIEAIKRRVLEEDAEIHDQQWLDRPGGRIFLDVYYEPIHDEAGRTTGIGIATVDLTPVKLAEDGILEIQAELRETDKRRMAFLTVLSHELRNALVPIRYALRMLELVPPGSGQALQARGIIGDQAGQMTRLIDDLLDVARISREKIRLQLGPVDLGELARRAVEAHRSGFLEQGLLMETEFPAGPAWVDGDPTRLTQVLGNLLHNAAKFTPAGGKAIVSIQVRPDQGAVELTVADNGCGIEPEQIPRLFEAFAQAERTVERSAGGLGLGLALVKGLVELHGGTVSCTSEGPGMGARFTVQLPLRPGPGAAG